MDELDLLKKDWQKKGDDLPKLSYNDIYQMIWKKSSSIVKWIFYISIIEFTLPHLFLLIPSIHKNLAIYEALGLQNFMLVFSVIQYSVIVYFIYKFYIRYREITVLDDSKNLMKKILLTRKTVKNYVLSSLSMILFISAAVVFTIYLKDTIELSNYKLFLEIAKKTSVEKVKPILMFAFTIAGLGMTLLLGGLYFLLYGILLKKLKRNYGELKKLEI